MRKRWYDNDPTLSMAISLLQNASRTHQEMTANYLLKLMERDGVLQEYDMAPEQMFFMFPLVKRTRFHTQARTLLEVMKRLPRSLQIEMSLNMINYVYLLDSGLNLSPEEESKLLVAKEAAAE